MTVSDKQKEVLEKVEKLLRKANSSEHPAESEAFTLKAQQLMTDYAIEEGMLNLAENVDTVISTWNVSVDGMAYSKMKAHLMAIIGRANECYVVGVPYSHPTALAEMGVGKRGFHHLVVYGTDFNIERTRLLWESLLYQLDVAIDITPVPEGVHGKTFRNNFIAAYAATIGSRLLEAKEAQEAQIPGSALMLASEYEKAHDEAHSQGGIRKDNTKARFDPRGHSAGREAGMRANLTRGSLNGS